MPVLTAEGICVAFGGVRALQDVNVSLAVGGIYGLIGPNGAGKTTLFNVLTGVVASNSGSVVLSDIDITTLPPHRRARVGLSRTFQNLALFPSMTVEQNVTAGLLGKKHGSWVASMLGAGALDAHGDRAVSDVLQHLGLEEYAALAVTALPLGTRKKVELARAIVSRPKLLLLDEPAAGLSPEDIDALCGLVRWLQGSGTTVLIVEHHVAMVMSLCEHIFVLDFGTLIAQGSPSEIRQHPDVLKAYLGREATHETA